VYDVSTATISDPAAAKPASAERNPAQPIPADLGVRIAARAIDVVVVAGIDVALGSVMGYGFDWLLAGTVAVLAYFTLSDALAGATLGKLALGLRVTNAEGGRPTLKQSLVRESFIVVGSIPIVGPLLALGTWIVLARSIRSNALRQGKHDLWAGGTRVVRR
jgi:uncharacterized RDD family membrane protein YckC